MNLPSSIGLVVPVEGAATHGEYALVEACLPAATDIPSHVTVREDVTLHLLHGELSVTVDGEPKALTQGDSVTIPKGQPRRLYTTRPSRLLALIAPAGLEQILSVIADPALDPDDRAALLAVGGVRAVPAA
jgi:quercetin dioxygenase-like cupin family protein